MAARKSEVNAMKAIKDDNFRIEIDVILTVFRSDPSVTYYSFKNTLTNVERKYIHERSRKMGLISRSTGKEPNRILTIFKRSVTTDLQYDINLTNHTNSILNNFFRNNESYIEKLQHMKKEVTNVPLATYGYLTNLASKPIARQRNGLTDLRKNSLNLPINVIRQPLLDMLETNEVIIITAETGSGKTTQVPQIILDDAGQKGKECRIICTQPRRLSTVAVADRVARERGENLPDSVGYQIKLESKLSPQASLIYATTGVLLKTLMNRRNHMINQFSHIIIDEIHERDRFTDFLLICLKEYSLSNPEVRIILMSATMDIQLFEEYLPGAQIFNVQGRMFDIEEYFLDDIIPMISYESYRMQRIREQREVEEEQYSYNVDDNFNEEMDFVITSCMKNIDDFSQMWQMILSENVSVNYVERYKGYTPLIAASSQGKTDIVKQLLYMGANKNHVCNDGMTALTFAKNGGYEDIVQILMLHTDNDIRTEFAYSDYLQSVSPEFVDFELISNIIIYIHEKVDNSSSILVFLSGYDDIISCNESITNSRINKDDIYIFMLHGSMNISVQNEVFEHIPGKQKIILATNVAETSITIDDVAYVIDTGRVKEKTYDTLGNAFALTVNWISKASAKQRAGRAGRCKAGKCFHIYSRERYQSMLLTTIPEILRVPLQELCLNTKLLAPSHVSIADFISRAMEPPTKVAIDKAIDSLKMLGALDEEENLTSLGKKLLHLSVEPQYGKILLYAITYKCLDPVLTIVSCLVNKDPFILPPLSQMNVIVMKKKKELSAQSLSDHMVYLRAFLLYQNILGEKQCARLWNDYFLSESVLNVISATRVQLMGQLRALGYVGSIEAQRFFNRYSDNWPVIKMVLLQGFYPNLAYYNNNVLHTRNDTKISFHKSSILKTSYIERKSVWFMYNELSKVNSFGTLKCSTAISPVAVALTCGKITHPLEDNTFTLDNWIEFKLNNEYFYKFKSILDYVNHLKIENIQHRFDRFENGVIETVVSLLSAEDAANGFIQPPGLGEAPKIITNRLALKNASKQINCKQLSGSSKSARIDKQKNKYILIKPMSPRYLKMGLIQNKWKVDHDLLCRITRYLSDGLNVILIFVVHQRRSFSGIARVLNLQICDNKLPIEWLSHNEVQYFHLKHLKLPNLAICQNGYELSWYLGIDLVQYLTNFYATSAS